MRLEMIHLKSVFAHRREHNLVQTLDFIRFRGRPSAR